MGLIVLMRNVMIVLVFFKKTLFLVKLIKISDETFSFLIEIIAIILKNRTFPPYYLLDLRRIFFEAGVFYLLTLLKANRK